MRSGFELMSLPEEKITSRYAIKRMYQLAVVGLVAGIVLLVMIPLPDDKVVILDVGQGDATLLQNGTRQVLIDGGQGMAVLRRLAEELPWFDRTIEVVILTHPARDHMEGLLHVLERYNVELILLPEVAHASQLQEVWLQKIVAGNIPYRFARAGQRLSVGDMELAILGPLDSEAALAAIRAEINNASVIIRVEYCPEGATPRSSDSEVGSCLSFLLTGDAEKRAETIITKAADRNLLDVDILKVGHHGSNSSTHEALIKAASPQAAVISVGADNSFGHPRQEVLDRLAGIPIWRTDESGSITFRHFKDSWLVATAR